MKLSVCLLLFLVTFKAYPQLDGRLSHNPKYPYKSWRAIEIDRANTVKTALYMSYDERMVVFFLNLARIRGQLFAKTYLQHYQDTLRQTGKPLKLGSINELQRELRHLGKRTPVVPEKDLAQLAKSKAITVGRTGDQNSQYNQNQIKRIEAKYQWHNEAGSHGYSAAIDIVIDLLLDAHDPKHQKRELLLGKELNSVGVSIQPHIEFGYICIVTLAYNAPPRATKSGIFRRFFLNLF